MDMLTIEQKLNDKLYRAKDEFIEDFSIMFDNCHAYNGGDSGKGLRTHKGLHKGLHIHKGPLRGGTGWWGRGLECALHRPGGGIG